MRLHAAVLALFLLSSCGANGSAPTPGASLVIYATSTPPAAVQRVSTMAPPTDGAIASPTPFSYVVVAGDTMSSIAQRFHVSLNELQAANPNVAPASMSIGTQLLIPSSQGESLELNPTPEPLGVGNGSCFPYAGGGLWCLVAVRNEGGDLIENVTAQMQVVDSTGAVIADRTTALLLDILRPGTELALAAYFPDKSGVDTTLQVRILTATRVRADEDRYLPVTVRGPLVEVLQPGYTARVSGQLGLPAGAEAAGTIWLAATAYDGTGVPVGVRR